MGWENGWGAGLGLELCGEWVDECGIRQQKWEGCDSCGVDKFVVIFLRCELLGIVNEGEVNVCILRFCLSLSHPG